MRMAASVITSPTSNPVVGDDRRTSEGYHAPMRFRRLAWAFLAATLAGAGLISGPLVRAQFDLQTLRIIVRLSQDRPGIAPAEDRKDQDSKPAVHR